MRRNVEVTSSRAADLVVGASATDQIVTNPFDLHGGGNRLAVIIRVHGVTVAAAITAKLYTGFLRTAATGAIIYRAAADKTVSITADGVFEIRLNAEDGTDLTKIPLGQHAKVTITTGAGDAVTVDEVRVVEVDRPT